MIHFNELHRNISTPRRYTLTLLIFLLSLALRFLLFPVESGLGFLTFYPATIITFYLCGLGPGALVSIMGAVTGYYIFSPPYWSFNTTPQTTITTFVFILSSCLIGFMANRDQEYSIRLREYEHKLAYEKQKESNENLQLAIDGARLGVWHWDIPSNEIECSDACLAYFGVTPGTPLNYQQFLATLHKDDVGRVYLAVARSLQNKTDFDEEFRVLWPDGSLHSLSSISRPFYSPNGAIERMEGVVQDITARKIIEADLVAQKEELCTLVESMPHIVLVLRPDGSCILSNRRWMDYTGLTWEQSEGNVWNTPIHPDDKDRVLEEWRQAVKDRATYSLECRIRRADGVYHWWLVRGVPAFDKEGKIYKWFATCTDIQELKEAVSLP